MADSQTREASKGAVASKRGFYWHGGAVLRDDVGNEICERCGTPTREALVEKALRGHPCWYIICGTCGMMRPAAQRDTLQTNGEGVVLTNANK